jgi:hypothetical protein
MGTALAPYFSRKRLGLQTTLSEDDNFYRGIMDFEDPKNNLIRPRLRYEHGYGRHRKLKPKRESAKAVPKAGEWALQWGQNMLIDGLLSLIDKRELSNPAITAFIAAAMTLVDAGKWTEFFAVVSGLTIYRNYDRITPENLYALLPDSDVSKWEGPSSWFGYDSNQSIRRRRRSTRQRRRRRTAHRRR